MDAKQKRVAVSLLTVTTAVLLSLLVAFESNSLVVRLDLVGGFLEIVALAVTWHALGRATRQANDDFNFGFAKLENLCGLLIAQVQFAYLLIFAWMAVQRLLSPVPPAGAGLALLLYAYGTVVTAAMLLWSRRLAKRAPSPVALALYRGYQVKVLANLATGLLLAIAALVPGEGWVRYLDPLNVLLLSAVRLRAIALVMAASGRDLLDAAAEEETRLAVYASLARHFDDYDDLVRLESRRSPQTVFVTLHLAFAEERPLAEVFQTIDRLSQDVRQRVPNAAVAVVPHPLRVKTAA